MGTMYCGIDWSERHHDLAVVDTDGRLAAKLRVPDTADGFAQVVALLVEVGDVQTTRFRSRSRFLVG
jgi:transposase